MLGFQRREWIAERIGRVIMGIVVIAAALGCLGPGLLSHTQVSVHGVIVQYDRFLRATDESELVVRLEEQVERARNVAFDRAGLEHMTIARVLPEPSSTRSDSTTVTYAFPAPGSQEMRFTIKPERAGLFRPKLVVESRGIELWQLVFP